MCVCICVYVYAYVGFRLENCPGGGGNLRNLDYKGRWFTKTIWGVGV